MSMYNCTLRENLPSIGDDWRIQYTGKPISGPAALGIKRLIEPDPENGARGSNHGSLGRTCVRGNRCVMAASNPHQQQGYR